MAWQQMLQILQRSFIPSSSFASVLAPLATKKRTTSAGETFCFLGNEGIKVWVINKNKRDRYVYVTEKNTSSICDG